MCAGMTVPEEPRTRRSNGRDSSSDVSDSENDSYSSGGSVSDSDAEDADHGDPSEMPITEEPKIEEPKVETPDPIFGGFWRKSCQTFGFFLVLLFINVTFLLKEL